MGNQATTDGVIRLLASKRRVMTLGGIAVIGHGLSRNTYDADIWLEPGPSSASWAALLLDSLASFPGVVPLRIATWTIIPPEDFAGTIENDGVCRLKGLERPLDIFRKPNEFEIESFDEVWERAEPLEDGTRLPDVIDLLVTKQDTGRERDLNDILFLEQKAENQYLRDLPLADRSAALRMLDRFLTPRVAEAAANHSDPIVRETGKKFLADLAADGDPFAAELLRKVTEA